MEALSGLLKTLNDLLQAQSDLLESSSDLMSWRDLARNPSNFFVDLRDLLEASSYLPDA